MWIKLPSGAVMKTAGLGQAAEGKETEERLMRQITTARDADEISQISQEANSYYRAAIAAAPTASEILRLNRWFDKFRIAKGERGQRYYEEVMKEALKEQKQKEKEGGEPWMAWLGRNLIWIGLGTAGIIILAKVVPKMVGRKQEQPIIIHVEGDSW